MSRNKAAWFCRHRVGGTTQAGSLYRFPIRALYVHTSLMFTDCTGQLQVKVGRLLWSLGLQFILFRQPLSPSSQYTPAKTCKSLRVPVLILNSSVHAYPYTECILHRVREHRGFLDTAQLSAMYWKSNFLLCSSVRWFLQGSHVLVCCVETWRASLIHRSG